MKTFLAHVKKVGDSWDFQLLADHLDKVAQRAGALASKFGASDWGKLVGLWHDLGKFHPAWQLFRKMANEC
jgi:CRISPR-associated endonuclease/helicase Cas3